VVVRSIAASLDSSTRCMARRRSVSGSASIAWRSGRSMIMAAATMKESSSGSSGSSSIRTVAPPHSVSASRYSRNAAWISRTAGPAAAGSAGSSRSSSTSPCRYGRVWSSPRSRNRWVPTVTMSNRPSSCRSTRRTVAVQPIS